MTWIGLWTIRLCVVFLGVFCIMMATNILGLNKSDNPFSSWAGFWQAAALATGIGILLAIEAAVEHFGWYVTLPRLKLEANGQEKEQEHNHDHPAECQ